MVDRSQLYPGAGVTVRGRVSTIGDNRAVVETMGRPDDWMSVPLADILSVEPRPLKVGDRVRRDLRDVGGVLIGEILHTHDDVAWVDYGNVNALESLADLTRLPEEEPTP